MRLLVSYAYQQAEKPNGHGGVLSMRLEHPPYKYWDKQHLIFAKYMQPDKFHKWIVLVVFQRSTP